MKHVEIKGFYDSSYREFEELYVKSFPIFEQRTEAQQLNAFRHDNYHLLSYQEEDRFIGFVAYWDFEDYVYIEHFAVIAGLRGQGYGSRILDLFKKTVSKMVLLEIDPVIDDISEARWKFYRRNGFYDNTYPHVHPAYRAGYEAHPLIVMTTERSISEEEYQTFQSDLCRVVMEMETGGIPFSGDVRAACVALSEQDRPEGMKEHFSGKIRPLGAQDIPEMQELFRSTILSVCLKDYSKAEAEDWASCGNSLERWKKILSENHFVGAFDAENRLVGFSSMNGQGYLHSMFVHKDCQNRGIATRLLAEVECMARQDGVAEITSEVSLTARPFFEKKGYEVVRAQRRRANELLLTNFLMRKFL